MAYLLLCHSKILKVLRLRSQKHTRAHTTCTLITDSSWNIGPWTGNKHLVLFLQMLITTHFCRLYIVSSGIFVSVGCTSKSLLPGFTSPLCSEDPDLGQHSQSGRTRVTIRFRFPSVLIRSCKSISVRGKVDKPRKKKKKHAHGEVLIPLLAPFIKCLLLNDYGLMGWCDGKQSLSSLENLSYQRPH